MGQTFRRWVRFFLLGILFEVVLITLGILLPESWLQVEIGNFLMVTHFPLMVLLNGVAEGLRLESAVSGVLFLLIGLALMGAVWGLLICLVTRLSKAVLARFVVSQNQRRVLKFGLGFLGAAILALAIIFNLPATPIPFTASPEVKSLVDGNTVFALDLYQTLKGQPGNLFFSPYSITASLAMTYAGARGQTETEMANVLHFNLGETNLPAAFGELATRMDQIQRWNRITLKTANSLWCQRGYKFTGAFLNLAHKFYHAEARQVDFGRSPQAAANEINKWVEYQTKGKIQNAVVPSQFTDLTKLVLCNAIYFKGKWQHQFKVSDTKPDIFHVTTNEAVTVPMMHQKADFKMALSDDYSVELLELPYSGTDLSMIILLPAEFPLSDVKNPSLPDLERKLTADDLRVWLAKLDEASLEKTWVALPRFTLTQSFDLVKVLHSMGMVSAFDTNADFSGMDGTTNLYISDVVHKSYVKVDESGTEAAAVSFELAKRKGQTGSFIADHPFIFLIRDNGSGSILFLGRIVNPTK